MQSHTIKLFDIFVEKTNGKSTTRTVPLGAIPMPFERNIERRKTAARSCAETHVGRSASNVLHTTDGNLAVYFRRA